VILPGVHAAQRRPVLVHLRPCCWRNTQLSHHRPSTFYSVVTSCLCLAAAWLDLSSWRLLLQMPSGALSPYGAELHALLLHMSAHKHLDGQAWATALGHHFDKVYPGRGGVPRCWVWRVSRGGGGEGDEMKWHHRRQGCGPGFGRGGDA
jgi:hypothetical protein